jgi:hypothetical protein
MVSVARVLSDLDIWRAANAELEAARLQDLMLERGDDEGRRVWARIFGRNRGAAGAAVGQVELKLHDAWDCLLDFAIATWLGLLDRVSPPPETPVDRAIREEGERLRRAFPAIDFDHPAPGSRGLATLGSG